VVVIVLGHRQGEKNWGDAWPKGTKTVVILADGTEMEAELLGADIFNDLSMLRLIKPGKYGHAKFDGPAAKLGDTIVKIGHPNGYQVGRTPALGRQKRKIVFKNRRISLGSAILQAHPETAAR
jgi:S1-C subfamily serine protease